MFPEKRAKTVDWVCHACSFGSLTRLKVPLMLFSKLEAGRKEKTELQDGKTLLPLISGHLRIGSENSKETTVVSRGQVDETLHSSYSAINLTY